MITQSNRLIIREFQANDANDLFELNADPEVLRFTGDPPFDSIEEAKNFIEQYDQYQKYGYGRWAVIRKSDSAFLGWCGLKYHPETEETDLGFRLKRKYWNHGFATEAADICLQYGFENLGLEEIIGRAMPSNLASLRVLEKIGMGNPEFVRFDEHNGLKYRINKEQYDLRNESRGLSESE